MDLVWLPTLVSLIKVRQLFFINFYEATARSQLKTSYYERVSALKGVFLPTLNPQVIG